MKNHKEILKLVMLLSQLLSVVARPTMLCSQTSEIERFDPSDPGAKVCIKCSECPEGQGLSPQCGSRITMDIKIECKPCKVNQTYSDSHGIESCKACQECGLKNVIEHCTSNQNRKCGTNCPQGYFLDHNYICQECYFCCHNVSKAGRRQGCKDIGMDKTWQCEKTEQNQRCKEALEKRTTGTTPTIPPDHNTMTDKHLKTKVPDNTTHVPHHPSKELIGRSKIMESQGTSKVTMLPLEDDSANSVLSTKQEKGQLNKHEGVSLKVVIGVVIIIALFSVGALISTKRAKQFHRFLRTKLAKLADSTELIPLQSMCEPMDSGRTSPQDQLTNVVSSKQVKKPNPADIPADCRISEMECLRDDQGKLMIFYIQKKLDVVETPTRKTWRSVGRAMQVSSDDLDLIDTAYKAGTSPTESLLQTLQTFPNEPTMREFVDTLVICDRNDVANYICNWPWAKLVKSVERENQP